MCSRNFDDDEDDLRLMSLRPDSLFSVELVISKMMLKLTIPRLIVYHCDYY